MRIFLIFGVSLFSLAFLVLPASAQNWQETLDVPTNCVPRDNYEPDFECINRKLLDPSDPCKINKCVGSPSSAQSNPDSFVRLIEVFDSTIAIDTSDPFGVVAVLVNLILTTVLGFISLYTVVRGIYVGGIVRARSIDDGEIAEANKTLKTMLMGFALAWGAIFIIQIITALIGLGSLNDLVILEGNPGDPANNQLIIQ